MQNQAIVLDQSEILCPLGGLSETVADLMDGAMAITPGSCFGVNAAVAPFADVSCRSITVAAARLKTAIDLSELDPAETVFLLCSSYGDLSLVEPEWLFDTNKVREPLPHVATQAELVRNILLPGCLRSIAVSQGSASGAVGLKIAKNLLDSGEFKHALLFGFDVVSPFVVTSFAARSLLSVSGARPFDALRNGLTLGDGACIALLTKRNAFEGDVIVASATSDAEALQNIPNAQGSQRLARVANAVIQEALLTPSQIGAVKCFGLGAIQNDAMESKALSLIFKENIPPCCSVTGALGHALGAASLMETLIAAQFLIRHALAPTAGFLDLGVNENIHLSAAPQVFEENALLSLSAGMGEVFTAIVLKVLMP